MRDFVSNETLVELAYGAHADTRFVAVADFPGAGIFCAPPHVAEAIYRELDLELLPHVVLRVCGGEVRALASIDALPVEAREAARALRLAGHAIWAFHASPSGTILAIGVDEVSSTDRRALEAFGLRRVGDATCGARWTLDLHVDPPAPPASSPPSQPAAPRPPRPAGHGHRLDLHATDVANVLAELEAILGVAIGRSPEVSSTKLGGFAHDASHIERHTWQGSGVVVRFEREVQHLYGIDVSYRIEVALDAPATTITFADHPVPAEVVVRGTHPAGSAVAAWMRDLVTS